MNLLRTSILKTPWHSRSTFIILFFILLFSAILGVSSAIQFRDSPFFYAPTLDEESYVRWAMEITEGNFLGSTVFYQAPLYPYFLALLFTVFGKSYMAVRLVQVLMGTVSVGVVFWIGRKLMGNRPALLAAGIMASYGGLYFYEILLLKATMVTTISVLSCAIGVAVVEDPKSKWRWIALGFSLGLLILLRGNFQAIVPFVLIWVIFYDQKAFFRERLFRVFLFAAGISMVLTPVTIRNFIVAGEIVLTTSQGGANFFIGNSERANGRYVALPFVRANPQYESRDFKKEAERRVGRELSTSEVSAFWFKEGFSWISKNSAKALQLLLHKVRLMIHQYEFPDNHSFYLTRDLFVSALWLPFLGFGLLWGPALIGMLVMVRKDRRASYPVIFTVLYACSIIPFYIVARYRVAVVPTMAVFSAAFVFWAYKKWEARKIKSLSVAATMVVASLCFGFLPIAQSRAGSEYYLLGNAYLKTGSPREAIYWYDKTLSTMPDHMYAINYRADAFRRISGDEILMIMTEARKEGVSATDLLELGKKLEQLAQTRQAVELYERATTKDPNFFLAYVRLGYLYANSPEVKDYEKATGHLNRALKINPDSLDTMDILAKSYYLAGNVSEARHWLEEVLRRDPNNMAAQQNLEMLERGKN